MSTHFKVRTLPPGALAVLEQTLTAPDLPTLKDQLSAQGHTVLSVQAMRTPAGSKKMAYPLFCREVRTLIEAGMTVVEAVETLSAREQLLGVGSSLPLSLLQRLQQGWTLSTALADMPGCPAVLLAAVRAGERTSNLAEALDDYLRFDHLVSQLRKKIVSASIYPALVTSIGLVISLFLLLVVMPNFSSMYESLRNSPTQSAALTIQVSQFVGQHRASVVGTLATLVLLGVWWVRSGKARSHAVALGQAVPWINKRIEDFQLAMMYQALALLLRGGYPLTQAMEVAGQSALSFALKAKLSRALASIERGGSVSQAISEASLCDEVGRRLMAAAERNGEFYRATQVVSQLHSERFELFIERLTRIVEPLLLLCVALVVGGIVVMMYLPVFDMATQLH